MSPIKRGGVYYLYIPKQKGGRPVLRTTGTTDPRLYRLMKLMVKRLKDERRWPLLNAVIDGRLTVGAVFDADRTKALDALEASLSSQALAPHVTAYLAVLKGRGKDARHIENVKRQLDAFLGKHTTTADLTNANVTAWLATLKTSSGTARQYCFAVTGFTRYLVAVDVLANYPLSKVVAPDKNQHRMTYKDAATDEKIVQATRADVRPLIAFIKGTGCDVSPAIAFTREDLNTVTWTVRLKGTKTAKRDVHKAIIEPWARPYLREIVRELPYAKPFAHITRSVAHKQHALACEAVKVSGYTLKDARHSVAVRMAEQGYTAWEIAEQLGNSPELVAKVYAAHIVKMSERVTKSHTGSAQ